MNSKAVSFIKNFSYTLSSNLVSLLVSTLVVLIVPKLIGIEEYGYWQLYLFYSTYVGFFHFGWNDGIYLRYGGKEYKELDKSLFFSQFYMMLIFQLIVCLIILFCSNMFIIDPKRVIVFYMTAICMLIVNMRHMLLYILLGTNRIKEYAKITIVDRIVYCCLIIVFIVAGARQYDFLIAADLIGKFIALLFAMYCCWDIVFRNISTFYFSFRETFMNINVGIKLMFATIASTLIIGVIRFGIERSWDVSTFGKVSLTLSITSFMMLFINAVGIIMFPILRRIDERKFVDIYITMRDFLMVILLGMLIFYYPFKVILLIWLPKYEESIIYMVLVFPMFVFEGKMALLINTYLKTMRKEKLMLNINLVSLSLSIIITLTTTILLKNLTLAIVAITFLLAFRCSLAEICLSKILKISLYKDMFLELTVVIIFVITGWFINSFLAVLLYAVAYMMYLIIKRKNITNAINHVKFLIKA